MSCSKRKIREGIIKTITVLNAMSLAFWICAIDAIISWQPWVIMTLNIAWLSLVGYANGVFVDTKPYYERMERYYDEM